MDSVPKAAAVDGSQVSPHKMTEGETSASLDELPRERAALGSISVTGPSARRERAAAGWTYSTSCLHVFSLLHTYVTVLSRREKIPE